MSKDTLKMDRIRILNSFLFNKLTTFVLELLSIGVDIGFDSE